MNLREQIVKQLGELALQVIELHARLEEALKQVEELKAKNAEPEGK